MNSNLDKNYKAFLRLTPKERQVFSILLSHRKKEAVGPILMISPRSVDSYVKTILEEFGESTIRDLVEKMPPSVVDRAQNGFQISESDFEDIFKAKQSLSLGNDLLHFNIVDSYAFMQAIKKLHNDGIISVDQLHEKELKRLSLLNNKNSGKINLQESDVSFLPMGNM